MHRGLILTPDWGAKGQRAVKPSRPHRQSQGRGEQGQTKIRQELRGNSTGMAASSQSVSQRAPLRLWETPPLIQTNAGAEPDHTPLPSGLSTTGAKASTHLPPSILSTSNKIPPTCFPHKSGAAFCGLCGEGPLSSPVPRGPTLLQNTKSD